MRRSKIFTSILLLLVIGLHAVPILQKLQGGRQTLWPFMAWGMYKNSRPPGPIQDEVRRIIGITTNGEKNIVSMESLGLSSYALERLYLEPMWRGDTSAAQQFASRINLQRDDPFVELRLESETYFLTDAGILKKENPVITYRSAH